MKKVVNSKITSLIILMFVIITCKELPPNKYSKNPMNYFLPSGYDTSEVDLFAIMAKSINNNNYISPKKLRKFVIYISDGTDLVDCDSVIFNNMLLENMTETDDGTPLEGQYFLNDNSNFTNFQLKLINYMSTNHIINLLPLNDLVLNNYLTPDTVSLSSGFYSTISGNLSGNSEMIVTISESRSLSEFLIQGDSTFYNVERRQFIKSNNGTVNLSSSDLSGFTPHRYYGINVRTSDYKTYMVGSKKLGVYYENANTTLIYLTN
jgi:hypothetical protein